MANNNNNNMLIPVAIGSLALGVILSGFLKKQPATPVLNNIRGTDETYLITDEDYSKLDIGTKQRQRKTPLNMSQKLKDAKLQRVVYGDDTGGSSFGNTFAGFVNTVNPYGQGPARELMRLPGSEGFSRSNTKGNTLNLY
jgi:hypothetical protein